MEPLPLQKPIRSQVSELLTKRAAFRQGVAGPAYEMKLLAKPWGFDLEKIKCPISIWWGTLDIQTPMSHANIYANLIPGEQLKIIKDEGHLSLIKGHFDKIIDNFTLNL